MNADHLQEPKDHPTRLRSEPVPEVRDLLRNLAGTRERLPTAQGESRQLALAKEGSFVRVTALGPESGWHLAALRLLRGLDREAEARRAEGGP